MNHPKHNPLYLHPAANCGAFEVRRAHFKGIVKVLAGVGGGDADARARCEQGRGREAHHYERYASLPAQPRRRRYLPRVEQH